MKEPWFDARALIFEVARMVELSPGCMWESHGFSTREALLSMTFDGYLAE
jgi:hypothetical protein